MALIGVVLVAGLLRVWPLAADLPYLYHPDETRNVEVAEQMLRERDPNPHFFNYPSLLFDVQAVSYLLVGAVADVPWEVSGPSADAHRMLTQGNGRTDSPVTYLVGRSVIVAFSVGISVLAFLLAVRVTGRWQVGSLAGLLVAVSPLAVREGRVVTPDTLAGFFALAAVFAAVLVAREGSTRRFLVAGAITGLAASAKYNTVLVALPLVVAHLVRSQPRPLFDWRLAAAGAAAAGAFLITTPYALLDTTAFLDGLRAEMAHYSRGHAGSEGSPLRFYLSSLWTSTGPLLLLAPLAFFGRGRSRWRELTVVATFVTTYLLFMSRYPVRFERNLIPLLGALAVLVAVGSWVAAELTSRTLPRRGATGVALGVAVGLLAVPLTGTLRLNANAGVDERADAREWIADHVPEGSSVLLESYGPWVDPQRYRVQGTLLLPRAGDADKLRAQGFDYVVASELYFGRFYAQPGRGAAQMATRYEELFGAFEEVARFGAAGQQIRILRVAPASKAPRSAMRAGAAAAATADAARGSSPGAPRLRA